MTTPRSDAKPGIEEIEADIARTREELADTVDQLAARLDVKARTQDRIRELRGRATDENGRPTPQVLGVAGVLATAVVVLVIWRARR